MRLRRRYRKIRVNSKSRKKKRNEQDQKDLGKLVSHFVKLLYSILLLSFVVSAVAVFLPKYYFRWYTVNSLMKQVTSNSYHRLYGTSYILYQGMNVGDNMLFSRLAELGYRMGNSNRLIPGEYSFVDNRLVINLINSLPGRKFDIWLDDSVVQKITYHNTDESLKELCLGRSLWTGFLDSIWEVRDIRSLKQYPDGLLKAVLNAEDYSFSNHYGIDLKGIARAALINTVKSTTTQGGSTITQQLVKTFLKRTERTYKAKIFEVLLALHLELLYSKEEILSAYLNNVYMGHVGPFALHGIARASQYLLGKEVSTLSPGECALLAGVIRSPNRLSPIRHKNQAATRTAQVLNLMKDRGDLNADYLYVPQVIDYRPATIEQNRLMAMAWVFQDLMKELDRNHIKFSQGSAKASIEVSIDRHMQEEAAELLNGQILSLESKQKKNIPLQGAIAVVEQKSGGVKAIIGGRDYLTSQFNRASIARRSVGSLIKPFVYLTAMASDTQGGQVTPTMLVTDTPMRVSTSSGLWKPQNYDRKYKGIMTLEQALIQSRNIPAVRMGKKATVERVARTVKSVGINPAPRLFPSLFLGACSSNVLQMASAYAALAQGGAYVAPQLIDRVIIGGAVVMMRRPEQTRVLDRKLCSTMTSMLQKVLVTGTGKSALRYDIDPRLAGKTGTSSKLRDGWFAGYSEKLTTVVWVGNDDNKSINLTGAEAALPIWARFMKSFGGSAPVTTEVSQKDMIPSNRGEGIAHNNMQLAQNSYASSLYREKKNSRPTTSDTGKNNHQTTSKRHRDQPLANQHYKYFK